MYTGILALNPTYSIVKGDDRDREKRRKPCSYLLSASAFTNLLVAVPLSPPYGCLHFFMTLLPPLSFPYHWFAVLVSMVPLRPVIPTPVPLSIAAERFRTEVLIISHLWFDICARTNTYLHI
jgi:hypothetical protein